MFVNNNLEELDLHINSLIDLYDGGYLIILIGMIGKFYVPLNRFKIKPKTDQERVINWFCKIY